MEAVPLHSRGQIVPVAQFQDNTEMRHGDALTVNRIVVRSQHSRFAQCWVQMTDELVAVKIEIDPLCIAAALRAAEYSSIEVTSLRNIAHLHGDMKRRQTRTHREIIPPLGFNSAAAAIHFNGR